MKVLPLLAAFVTGAICSGCIFEYPDPCPTDGSVAVNYNWNSVAADSVPRGMSVLFYPLDGYDYWRFELPAAGGEVELDEGTFDVLTFNNDTRSVMFNGLGAASTAMAYTAPTTLTSGLNGVYAESAPPPRSDASQPVCAQPDMMYAATVHSFSFSAMEMESSITLAPTQFTCCYKVIVENVTNTASIGMLSMSLNGLASYKHLATGTRSAGPVEIPATLTIADDTTLAGSIVSFGPAANTDNTRLSVNLWLKDGQKRNYVFDVSQQIIPYATAMNLTIRVGGIDLPEIENEGDMGNIQVGVDNWDTIDIELTN